MPYRSGLLLGLLAVGLAAADEAPRSAREWLRKGVLEFEKRQYDAAAESLTRCLKQDANNARALHVRGCVQFLRGKFAESAADFDRCIEIDPTRADGHWQRGITLYYAGRYEAGMKQFGRYEKVDTNDVENAVWHFLCAARKDGLAKARAGILNIGKDGRTPMMQVYALFQGKLQPADVLAAANAGELTPEQRKPQLFYANLYLGLYHDVLGEKKRAIEHLKRAAGKYKIDHYMGEVARVHLELLTKKK